MTSPEKLATLDSVMALFRRAKSAYGRWVHGPTDDGLRECIERDNELRREVEALATQRQGEGETRDAALEQAANLVECEYAADATQGRRLAQIAQHIRDLKNRKPL